MKHALHFVGFRDGRYFSATKVFGTPDFVHPRWDRRASDEVMDGDVVVFANGTEADRPADNAWDDSEQFNRAHAD
jgi:hypothetical protein